MPERSSRMARTRTVLALAALVALTLALSPAAAAAAISDPPVPGAEPFEGGWVVPVSTDGPA